MSGRPSLAEQKTPHTDAWVALIAPLFTAPGNRADFARHVEGDGVTTGKIVRWTNVIHGWLNRKKLPSLEQYFLVTDWLNYRARTPRTVKKKPRKTMAERIKALEAVDDSALLAGRRLTPRNRK